MGTSGAHSVPKQAVKQSVHDAGSEGGRETGRPRAHQGQVGVLAPGAAGRGRGFRPDIEGLRAVAVLLVVAAHSGLALKGGYVGVDVFFVISGFLITRQLYGELNERGRISFGAFYARRARRIIPAAVVVIVATLGASWAVLSPLRIKAIADDAIFSAVSGINWRLAAQGTDYFQSTAPPSPFQHYWSLAVEEQFYAVWPVLLVLTALLLGRMVGRHRAIVGLLVVILAASCAASVMVTRSSAPWAYFGSETRAWELGLGALVAVGASILTRLPSRLAGVVSWLGIAMVAFAALRFTDSTPYPGSAALVPVLGAVLVIAAGCARPQWGAETVLRLAPMQFGGRVSYSWYLWHWPVLILTPAALGHPLDVPETLAAVGASLALATVTFFLVEQPIRIRPGLVKFPQRGIGLGLGMAAAAVVVAVTMSANVAIPGAAPAAAPNTSLFAATAAGRHPGDVAAIVQVAAQVRKLPAVTPALDKAADDGAAAWKCFGSLTDIDLKVGPDCVFGDPHGKQTVILFGDSHAGQWSGPVEAWAERNHWKMMLVAKSSCSPGEYPDAVSPQVHRVYTECGVWREKALSFIGTLKPALVVVAGSWTDAAVATPAISATVSRIGTSGAKMIFMADTPRMSEDPPDCLAQHADDIRVCSTRPVEAGISSAGRVAEIEGARRAGATIFDPIPFLCTEETCPTVIGDVEVYRDAFHVTNTYAMTLQPQIGAAMDTSAQ